MLQHAREVSTILHGRSRDDLILGPIHQLY